MWSAADRRILTGNTCAVDLFSTSATSIVHGGLSKWRKRIKSKGMEALLQRTLVVGLDIGAVKQSRLKRVSVDTTVQPEAIAHPTDANRLNGRRERLVKLARKEGIPLRQSYNRKGPQTVLNAGRYAHTRQMNRMRKQVKCLPTYLGRIVREVERKANNISETLNHELGLAKQLIKQQRDDKKTVPSA